MSQIRIVHWDDDEEEIADFRIILDRAFGNKIDYISYCSPIRELENKLINKEESFDLLILDLLDNDNKLVGNRILKQLSEKDNVIVLTRSADAKIQNLLKDDVIKVLFSIVYKSNGKSEPYKYFIPVVEQLTNIKRNSTISFKLVWDEFDVNSDYQISLVTEEHLINLMTEYFNRTTNFDKVTSIRIDPITNGFSGAIVFKVLVSFDQGPNSDILLKVDRQKINLQLELNAAVGTKYKQFRDYKVNYDRILLCSDIDGSLWYGLIADFIVNGETLKSKTLTATKYDDIEKLYLTLFQTCLKNTYSNNPKLFNSSVLVYPVQEVMKILDKKKKAFILNAVAELSTLTIGVNKSLIEEIFRFNLEARPLNSEKNQKYNKIVLTHNDLHGNNVMVSEGGIIKIIDPANMGDGHWTRDLCMLIVDLFSYGVDYNDKEYFGIAKISYWQKMGANLFTGMPINNKSKDKIVCKIVSNLTNPEYIKNKLGFDQWFELWEFQLSLVIEFLRVSYKSSQLPAGKRAASLLIAIDGFKFANDSYKKFINQQ